MKQLITILALLFSVNGFSQQLAFPCAQGAGAYATGGRGGTVLHVTNLLWNNSPGSLKWALEQPYTRTIVFDVAGIINVTSMYGLSGTQYSNLTIAGQTAPAGGIAIKHVRFIFDDMENVIMRHVRLIANNLNQAGMGFSVGGHSVIDHCSFRYSGSAMTLGMGRVEITSNPALGSSVQNNLFSHGLTGLLAGPDPDDEAMVLQRSMPFSIHHNLYAHIDHRFPNISGNGDVEIINNIVYNGGGRMAGVFNKPNINWLGNYIRSSNDQWSILPNVIATYADNGTNVTLPQIYTENNIVEHTGFSKTDSSWTDPLANPNNFQNDDADLFIEWDSYDNTTGSSYIAADENLYRTFTKFPDVNPNAPVTTQDVDSAYLSVIADVGANKSLNADGSYNINLDNIDSAVITDVINKTGVRNLSNVVSTVISAGSRPANFYVSNPHIPEVWFLANVPAGEDHNDTTVNGYTWLEEYFNQVDNTCGGSPAVNNCTGKNAPVASLTTPINGTYNKADTLNFGVNYTADTTVSTVAYYLNGSLLANTTTPFTTNTTGLAQGIYTVYGLVTDVCGNTSNTDTVNVTITPLEVNACNTQSIPVIDGVEDAMWSTIPSHIFGVTENGLTMPSASNVSANYKIAWDATALYFFVKVTDDILFSDDISLQFYRDDAVSIYIDALDDNSTTYDTNDYYFGFQQGSTDIIVNNALHTGVGISKTDVVTPSGYNMEVKIDWTYLGITPTVGNDIGLDFRVDDDDNGGSRDHHLLWNDETSTLWNNPSKFGVLKLVNTACNNTTTVKNITEDDLVIYPNPTNGDLTITSSNLISKIEVYNTLGALVYSKNKLSAKSQELNLIKLPKGAYSVKVYEAHRVVEKQLVKQ